MIESKLEETNPMLLSPDGVPMHELVASNLKIRLSRALNVPSLAGTGLPERMRTTAFAFLGLTAAACLALVAIFAQVSFHVLSPAPLPSEPVRGGAVAEAVALDHSPAAFVPAASRQGADGGIEGARAGSLPVDQGSGSGGSGPGGAPAAAAPAPSGGGVGTQPTAAPAPNPVPAAAGSSPDPAPAPDSTAISDPAPGSSGSAPKPAPTPARPASPEPAAPPAPGNSSSSAAAAHASDRGVEASSKSSPTVEPPPAATGATPAPGTTTGSDSSNGKALGHTK
jgi:hypothetical protein